MHKLRFLLNILRSKEKDLKLNSQI